jgi:hypothetical protein
MQQRRLNQEEQADHAEDNPALNQVIERNGSVSKVEIATPMDLIYKVLFPSISTFETSPRKTA